MRAVLLFTLVAGLVVAGAWWIAGLPGSMSATIAGTTIEAATPVALSLLAALFLAIYVVVRLLVGLVRLPRTLGRARRDSNRRRGDLAVTRALTALAANDTGAARREADRSRRLLGDTPLTLLLAAQAGRQAGRENEAAEIFQRLADRPDGRLLGLRGLLRQAIGKQDWTTAAALAQRAEAAHPGAAWLTEERRYMALQTGQWREALRLTGPARGRGADAGARAALGIAAAQEETDPNAALRLAKQAWEAEPSLAPAAIAYAERLRTGGRDRAALDTLRRAWSLLPQPSLAEAYVAPIADRLARMRAAQELAAANPAHPDTALMLARMALDAGLTGEARRHAETARRAGLDARRVWVLLADLAEADGDAAGSQEALRHIPAARPDPAWQCGNCGTVHQAWHPVCEACGVPGRIGWTDRAAAPSGGVRLTPAAPAAIEGFG